MSTTSTKPASGFRDFLPDSVRHRERVFRIIEETYRAHGFEPLETPAMERLDVLLGKYGEEGDQLLFKVLQRGEKLQRALSENESPGEAELADMGLRYDLTVPLARVYAEYRGELPRFFKRYQLAPVWRADRPQKGRYREFFQCDVDVVGSASMVVEAEVCSALAAVLDRLGFTGWRIHVNHRQLLRAIIEAAGIDEAREADALVAIDKLDKVGAEGVAQELAGRGFSGESIDKLAPLLEGGTTTDVAENGAKLERLEEMVGHLERGRQGLDELRDVLRFAARGSAGERLLVDPVLARGLSYYTGPIFEIRSDDFSGSLGGGGRYDGLIGMFCKQDVPACGFSLGVERILLLMAEREMIDEQTPELDVMVTLWDGDFAPESLRLAQELRAAGLRVDVYPKPKDKYGKQFGYADERRIPFVAILAPRELEADQVAIKDMRTGEQQSVARAEVVASLMAQLGRHP